MRFPIFSRATGRRWSGAMLSVALAFAGFQAMLGDAQAAPGDAQVTIADYYFAPPALTVSPGTTVVWLNRGPSLSTATSDDGSWGSGALNPGGSFSQRFDTAGTFSYHCAIHPSMVGRIVVGSPAGGGQSPLPPPFGYTPYAPYGPGYLPYGATPGYSPYGATPGYAAPVPVFPPYGPGYVPYGPGYAPYGPGMAYPGFGRPIYRGRKAYSGIAHY